MPVSRDDLERRQMWWYLGAVLLGFGIGSLWPQAGHVTEALVWPTLAALLYATFTQMPLATVAAAFRDGRFLATALLGNFLLIPILVWGLVQFIPDDDALRMGVLLVLLVPCTDWFITFTHLGGGDATRATAFTPVSLVLQLLLLPIYLWLIDGVDVASVFAPADVWPALLVVLGPLVLAAITERWARGASARQRRVEGFGWWPVPLLAVVILFIATAHVGPVGDNLDVLPVVVAVAAAFLVFSLVLAKTLSLVARLPMAQGRTLAFSLGTRNSFIVLPFALALPAGWEVAAIVIVMQSLVELFGMIVYLWSVPRVVFPDRPAIAHR